MTRRPIWLALLAISLALAGCAAPPADPAGTSGTDVLVDEDEAPEGETSDETDASSTAERWHGFDFDQRVEPRSGGAGTLKSFAARMTEEEDGKLTVYDVEVEVGAVSTRDIRTKLMSFADGTEEIITTPLEVRELSHTVTVVRDDTGERTAGDVLVFRGYEPVDASKQEGTFLLGYAAMEWTDEEGKTGLMEYYVPPGQEPPEGAMYLPYQEGEGDFSGHWGFSLFSMAYNPIWLAGWSDGAQEFEEGSWSFGGHSYVVERKTLSVSGYTFDGWHVEWSASSQGTTATWSFEVATSLPVPFAYHFGGGSGSSSDRWSWELRELALG